MATLLLRLQGPMQSWGTSSRFDERDTQLEPSKSGVIGLLCAALGRDRSLPVADLAALRMGVRVDREGVPMRDYQTATGVYIASGKADRERTVVSPRYYLSDAVFLVGLEGEDRCLLESLHAALRAPTWPLSLGRKSFVPGAPVYLPDGVLDLPLLEALQMHRSLLRTGASSSTMTVRALIEHDSEGAIRLDQPVGPFVLRRFGPRFIQSFTLKIGGGDASLATGD
ncbi:type I-E CRISPR-associated protein Cas5/CasD [Bordetella genomosp. 13]|uniref:Type I-E CRISPR-associated protein Cas5/CasD n=1 Tax=Bordetella genomosp. 13 TaxID=463040 RepID=A0A1W6ZHB4_9BORD|nr:type I-E CRISPR-associated protein Cas5/CasD [Bordetella genomosp. 13]ARP96731.1 type I-E CRISPR-associated protein Cas5/CasD [Bordetella genomosp. 13]